MAEHVELYKKGGAEAEHNHIYKHMQMHHKGVVEPRFVVKPVKYFRSALKRQVAEAVRIRRRGEGSVLNSKAEYEVGGYPGDPGHHH